MVRSTNYVGHSANVAGHADMNGIFDELKIFNRSLSATEILTEMNKVQPYDKISF